MDNNSYQGYSYQNSFSFTTIPPPPPGNSPKREVRTGGFSAEKARIQRLEDNQDRIRSNRLGDFQQRRTGGYAFSGNDMIEETASENDEDEANYARNAAAFPQTQTQTSDITESSDIDHDNEDDEEDDESGFVSNNVKIVRYPTPPPDSFYPSTTMPTSSSSFSASALQVESTNQRQTAKEFLTKYHWPDSMQEVFLDRLESIPIRYYLVCDTTSMINEDKKRVITLDNQKRFVKCSRWTELVESLKFTLLLSDASTSLCDFRFLSGNINPTEVGFAKSGDKEQMEKIRALNRLLETYPTYSNDDIPVCQHIQSILKEVEELSDHLKAKGHKACITIATDSIPTDGDIVLTLKAMKKLPVCILIRLCTDDPKVLTYWQNVCEIYKAHVEVIDDYNEECIKVHEHNPWLTYTQAIHHMREYGVHMKELSLLGNTTLTKESFHRLARMIYGEIIESFPPPEDDMKAFLSKLKTHLSSKPFKDAKVWNPVVSKDTYHINCSEAYKVYVGGKL